MRRGFIAVAFVWVWTFAHAYSNTFVEAFYELKDIAYSEHAPEGLQAATRRIEEVISVCVPQGVSREKCLEAVDAKGPAFRAARFLFEEHIPELEALASQWAAVKKRHEMDLPIRSKHFLDRVCGRTSGSPCSNLVKSFFAAEAEFTQQCPIEINKSQIWRCAGPFEQYKKALSALGSAASSARKVLSGEQAKSEFFSEDEMARLSSAAGYIKSLEKTLAHTYKLERQMNRYGLALCTDGGRKLRDCQAALDELRALAEAVISSLKSMGIDESGAAHVVAVLDGKSAEKVIDAASLVEAIEYDLQALIQQQNGFIEEHRPWYTRISAIAALSLVLMLIGAAIWFNIFRTAAYGALILVGGVFLAIFTKPEKGVFTDAQICKATIAAEMGRSPSIIGIDRIEGGTYYLSYTRPNDRTRWHLRCKVDGHNVVWASQTGRWRDSVHDARVTFTAIGERLVITMDYGDGSKTIKSYKYEEL